MDVQGEASGRSQDTQVGLGEKAELETDPGLGLGGGASSELEHQGRWRLGRTSLGRGGD